MLRELSLEEESMFSPSRIKAEETHNGGSSGRLSTLNSEVVSAGRHPNSTNSAATAGNKKASSMAGVKDGPSGDKVEDPQVGRNDERKKPNSSGSEGTSLMELSGYNPKRHEFEPEYDNDAEKLLTDMEFKDSDTEEERELMLRVLHIYSRRLDERERRKIFILERNLLHPSPFERGLTPEEKALCRSYDPYMRFHSKEDHEELLRDVVEKHRMLKRIEELKEARAAGCRTSAEADMDLEQKRKKEAEENSRRLKDNAQIGPSNQRAPNAFMPSESVGKDSSVRPVGQDSSSYAKDSDITGFYGTQLQSETEKQLRCEIHQPPPTHLKMQEVMSTEIFNGQGSSDGKGALYHCNYCNRDIAAKIRIKCAECLDFDLCVECFSSGAEVTPHKSNHPYRVMDTLSFSLFSPDWNADEEMLLLEGIEMYGFGNWSEVAEHVGTKTKEKCTEHYNSVYVQSPCFPLPDMSLVAGKNKEELLAMAKGHSDTAQNSGNHDGDPANIGGSAADNSADVE